MGLLLCFPALDLVHTGQSIAEWNAMIRSSKTRSKKTPQKGLVSGLDRRKKTQKFVGSRQHASIFFEGSRLVVSVERSGRQLPLAYDKR